MDSNRYMMLIKISAIRIFSQVNLLRQIVTVALACLLFVTAHVNAENIPSAPDGEPALIISGNLSNPNVGDEIHLDLEWIKNLPTFSFITDTPWSEGKQEFLGVRLSVLFDTLGITAKSFSALALDNYKADVDVDWRKYPVIIAYQHNGTDISIRRLGPLRIIFPFDDYPELLNDFNITSAVWQLTHIDLF